MDNKELKMSAEIAFENVYHKYAYDMDDEAALEEAVKVYESICGEKPDLKDQFGWRGCLDDETIEEILNGTWQEKHL